MPDGQTNNNSSVVNFRGMRALRSAVYTKRPVVDGFLPASDNKSGDQSLLSAKEATHGAKLNTPKTTSTRQAVATRPALPRQKPSVVLHRSSFGAKMARKTKPKFRKQPKTKVHYALSGMVVVLLLCGLGVGVNAWHINRIAKTQVAVLAKTVESNVTVVPSEEETGVVSNAAYRVAPDLPRLLTIPKMQVSARVQRVGVNTDNTLIAPTNIHDVGWYDRSTKPGESGTIVLDGHVSGPTKHGVFYSLDNLRENDEIMLERGDGAMFHYKVVKQGSYEYDKVDMQALLSSAVPGKPGLNLITASGRFDIKTNQFEKRTVIFAVLAQ